MTTQQLAQALIVAIATAFATSVLNNWFELRRLQSVWKRETDERIAYYRKQRLEQRLASIEEFINQLLAILQPLDVISGLDRDQALQRIGDAGWAVNSAFAASRAVGDTRLTAAIGDLDSLMGEASRMMLDKKVSSEDSEWLNLLDKILDVAGGAFTRLDELPEDAYAEGLSCK